MNTLSALLALAALCAANLSAQMQAVPDTTAQIATGGDTLQVVYWAQAVTPRLQRLLVHNRTDHPVFLRGYRLSSCVGIPVPACGYHEASVLLVAHGTASVGQVATRRDIRGGFRYQLTLEAGDTARSL